MPLVNRAPIDDATGKLKVTATIPTAAWPSLGGMTYDPVTGELAVIDAVPAANDPWVGGIRFTHLGSMYVTTALPSPLFYIGGIVVSADGRVFFSSNPPLYAVGGWPIAADGGVAGVGSGVAPVPIFFAPLTTSLIPTLAGNPTFTFTRATTAYVTDNEGILRNAIASEARFQGARRVQNYVTSSQDASGAAWIKTSSTVTFGATGPTGLADANTVTATVAGGFTYTQNGLLNGKIGVNSVWIRRRTGTGTVALTNTNNANIDITAQLDGTWRRFATAPVAVASAALKIQLSTLGDQVDFAYAQMEDVTGQVNQAPAEYVSRGVLAAPFHGNAVDGVKYFGTTNGNSVAANVVTEAAGTAIDPATMLGYVAENLATNLCLRSQEFDSATWSKTNATATPNTQAAPDGTLTADVFTDDATSGMHRIFQSITHIALTGYTFSVYAKAGTLQWMQVLAAANTTSRWANFDLVNGVVGNKEASVVATITALPNGWYRCSITYTAEAVGGGNVQILSSLTNVAAALPTYVGTGQTMFLWGAQVEAFEQATSYIPTTTAAVARNVDNLTYPIATNLDFSVAGTLYSEFFMRAAITPQRRMLHYTIQNRTAQRVTPLFNMDSPGGVVSVANAVQYGNVLNKGVVALSGATGSACLNGGTVGTGAAAGFSPSGSMEVGNTALPVYGNLRNVKFYATRLTDVQLQGLTA
jgi:hypothetical protein